MKRHVISALLATSMLSMFSKDMILEFKGSYFLPTSSRFKECYKGSVLFGPEFTFQLRENKNWYAFISLEYFKQKGRFLSLCDSTTLRLLPLTAGIKYFLPIHTYANFYFGFGFQSEYIHQKSRRALITSKKTWWGFGGRGKIGSYIKLPHNFIIDLFFDYSFVWTSKNNFYGHTAIPVRTNGSGAIFGAALGYRF